MIVLFSAFAVPPPAVRHDLPVAWSTDGTRVQVGNHVHDPTDGSTRKLPPTWRYSELSPNGALSARVDGTTLTIVGEARSPFEVEVGDAVTSWLTNTTLLVIQRTSVFAFTCATLTVDQPAVTPVTCPTSDYHMLYGVIPGPSGQLAVQSAGEGHPGVKFITWSPETQAELKVPRVDLYPAGPLVPSFARDRVFAYTPCDLRKARGCTTNTDQPAYVFSARPNDVGWTLEREGLPTGLAYDPVHDRFAWAERERWCIGDLRTPATCRPLDSR